MKRIVMLPSALALWALTANAKEYRMAHNFGKVEVGSTVTSHWNLRAKQDQQLHIQKVTLTGDDYTLETNCPEVLPPEQKCTVRAYFTPKQQGLQNGSLVVDLYSEQFIIDMSGEGVTP
ncbi:MAG: DUF1573 domain-containing protein [Bdellovibrio sp.]|nr:DUF1573 domain-containing protein [Bdellovibrio sp.]